MNVSAVLQRTFCVKGLPGNHDLKKMGTSADRKVGQSAERGFPILSRFYGFFMADFQEEKERKSESWNSARAPSGDRKYMGALSA